MQISFKSFHEICDDVLEARLPVLIRGRHGIGKSEVVYQAAKRLGLPVVERRASQMTEGDLVGLPSLGDGRTSWNPPDWFKTACEEPVLLFLDEVDRAVIEVRQGIFELTDSRKLNGHHLHEGTLVMAAVNGGEAGEQYQVGEMDPAELDRWTTYDLNPTVEDWMEWANDGNINPVITDFIRQNTQHLEHKGDFEPNKKYPSRRSWKRFNDVLESGNMLNEWNEKIRVLGLGFVGFEASIAFADFFQNYDRQVTPEDIIVKGKHELVENFGTVEHCALIEKMNSTEVFKKELDDNEVANVAKYILMMPSEPVVLLWGIIGRGEIKNTVKIHNYAHDGMKVSKYIASLLTGQTSDS